MDEFEQYADDKDEFEKFVDQPKGDTTPFDYKKKPLMIRGGLVVNPDIRSEEDKARAAKGINVDYTMPAKASFIQSLASNKDEANSFVGSYLNSAYPDAPRRIGDRGNVEFLDPLTKRWTEALAGAAGVAGELPEALFSTAGGVGGGMAGGAVGGPAGAALGSSAGTGIGQFAGDLTRQAIGKFFGINQSQDLASMSSESVPEAVGAAGLDLGVAGLYGAGRGVKTWLFGRQVLKPHEAQALLTAQQHADALVTQINREVGGIFHPTTAQKGAQHFSEPAERMLSAQGQARTNPYTGHDILANQQSNERALDMYFDNATLSQRMQGVNGPSEGGEPLRQAINDEGFNKSRQLVAEKANAEDAGKAALEKLPSQADKGGAGRAVRTELVAKYSEAKKATDAAYGDYKSLIKETATQPSAIAVPWSRDVKGLQKTLRAAIERSPRERSKQARNTLLLDTTTNKEISLSDLDDMLKDLRDDIRSGTKGKLDVPLNLRDAKRLEKSLTGMRNDFLQKSEPEVYDALMKAEKAQANESNLFKYGLTQQLLKPDGRGRFKITDAGVIAKIVKNQDAGAAKELGGIVRSNPDAMLEVQNYLFAMYRRQVDPKGGMVPNAANHAKFMQNYGAVVKEFFTPEQAAQLNQLGGFADVISTNTMKIKALNRIWANDFKGRLKSMSSEDLVEAVNGKFDVDEVRKLHTLATAYGEDVTKAWKAGVAEDLRGRLFKGGDHIDPRQLSDLVTDYDRMKKLSILYGPGYIKSLNTLNDAMKMITRISRDIDRYPKNTLFTDIARMTYAPPLSQGGRVVTLGQNNRARSFYNRLWAALNDPAELSNLANRTSKTMQTMRALDIGTNTARSLEDLQND